MDLPHRNALLVVAVAALAVMAGCTGGSGPGTATPANNSTDGQDIEPMEQLNGSELNNATNAAVESGGSYTNQVDSYVVSNTSLGESESVTSTTTRADFEAERGIRETEQSVSGPSASSATVTVYTDGNTSYQRINSSQGVNYAVETGEALRIQPVNLTSYTWNYTTLTDSFDYQANGTTTVEGTTTVRYDSTNLTDTSAFVGGSNATMSNASSTMYVDGDGVVRQVSLTYTIESSRGSSTLELTSTLTGVGSTTVEEPGWLDEARNSTTETPS